MIGVQFVFLLLVVPAAMQRSHEGREFYVGMFPHYHGTANVRLDVVSRKEGSVVITVPYNQQHDVRRLKRGVNTVTVLSVVREGTYTEKRGIYLKSDVNVSVYVTGIESSPQVRDTYLALPLPLLGNFYEIASYESAETKDFSTFIAVGTANGTNVNVTYHNSKNMVNDKLNLERLDVLQRTAIADLTYTKISSNNPLAVFSGSACAFVPSHVRYCDFLIEQLVPRNLWTTSFIVPAMRPKRGYIVKTFSAGPNSDSVCFTNSSRNVCKSFHELEYVDSIFGTSSLVVSSTSKFSVTLYGLSLEYDNVNGDPFMMNIPGIQNYLNEYTFTIPDITPSADNYLCIIVPVAAEDGLLLDEQPIASYTVYERQSVPNPFSNYTILKVIVKDDFHDLRHQDQAVLFGALVYGIGDNVGFGYPAGFGLIDEVKKPVYCFNCSSMSSLALCDNVERCNPDEVCYIKQYETVDGNVFISGCLPTDQCKNMSTSIDAVCTECCQGHFCNNKGCGDQSFPDRNNRGPVCFNCQNILKDPGDCNQVVTCANGELCSVEQRESGDEIHYKMGCADSLCSPSGGSADKFSSISCCQDDFCNRHSSSNADSGKGPEIIG